MTINESSSFIPKVRTLSLELTVGSKVEVRLEPQDEDRLTVDQDLTIPDPDPLNCGCDRKPDPHPDLGCDEYPECF